MKWHRDRNRCLPKHKQSSKKQEKFTRKNKNANAFK